MEKRCTMKIEIFCFSFRFYSPIPVVYRQLFMDRCYVHMHTTERNDFMLNLQARQKIESSN